jgi:hypothetical protein
MKRLHQPKTKENALVHLKHKIPMRWRKEKYKKKL